MKKEVISLIVVMLVIILAVLPAGDRIRTYEAGSGTGQETENAATDAPDMEEAAEGTEEEAKILQEEWNMFREALLIQNYQTDAETGNVYAAAGFVTISFIPVSANGEYVLYVPAHRVSVIYYDIRKQFISGSELSAEDGAVMAVPGNCVYMTVSMPREALGESFLTQEDTETKELLIVSGQGTSYSSVNRAVSEAASDGIILVLPGIYNENVRAWGKAVTIYGADRERCILESCSGSYYAPPLEISAGCVKNMSIRAVEREAEEYDLYAYGVHVEDHFLSNNTLVFENCTISSDFNSAVGIGLRGGCTVEFIDVTLTGKEDGLFCHDSAYASYTGIQNISLIRCVAEGVEGERAIRFDSQGVTGAVVNVCFIDNILINKNTDTQATLIYTRNNNGAGTTDNWMGLKNYYIMEESCGNNVEELNYR